MPHQILIWGGCFFLGLMWHSDLIVGALEDFSNDSFHSLSGFRQIGLAGWSGLIIAGACWLASITSSKIYQLCDYLKWPIRAGLIVDLVVTVIGFTLLYQLTPQIYYFYFQVVIPDLPWQWVLKPEFDIASLIATLLQPNAENYAELLVKVTFWVILLGVIWRFLVRSINLVLWKQSAITGLSFAIAHGGWSSLT